MKTPSLFISLFFALSISAEDTHIIICDAPHPDNADFFVPCYINYEGRSMRFMDKVTGALIQVPITNKNTDIVFEFKGYPCNSNFTAFGYYSNAKTNSTWTFGTMTNFPCPPPVVVPENQTIRPPKKIHY